MPIPTIQTRRHNSLTLCTLLNLDSVSRNNQTSTTFDFGLAYQILKVKLLSRVQLFATPWTIVSNLLHPWNFLGKSTGVGCHFLLQGIFPTQGSILGLPHCRQMPYPLSHQESPNLKDKTKIRVFTSYLKSRKKLKHTETQK